MAKHVLKTWPEYFQPIWDRTKTFEVRYDDRAFQSGDQLELREWQLKADCECRGPRHYPTLCPRFTGRVITATVGFVCASLPAKNNQQHGFRGNGYVVMSLVDLRFGRPDGSAFKVLSTVQSDISFDLPRSNDPERDGP